ncbi:MAG: substrate-binding domain-containing protein [Actinobacteria bacterium]|nr:substrate-binding domain-containing protein [Actinomycetota bacterium]
MFRRRRRLRFTLACGLLAAAAVLTACGSEQLDGRVSVVGSSSLLPMMSSVASAFSSQHSLVSMQVRMTGTSDGVGLFCDGLAAVTGASRPLNERERGNCEASKIRYVRLQVANDGVILFTADDPSLPHCVTTDQVYALMGPQSMNVATWADASTVIPGAGAGLPNTELNVIGPDAGAGTRQVLIDLLISPIAKERGMVPTLRADYTAVPSEQLVPTTTASAVGGLGFTGMALYREADQGLLPLAIDNGEGCVTPSEEHVRDGTYALGRALYVYVNLDEVKTDPTLDAFIDQLLWPSSLAMAASTGGVALSEAEADAVRAHWARARSTGNGDTE